MLQKEQSWSKKSKRIVKKEVKTCSHGHQPPAVNTLQVAGVADDQWGANSHQWLWCHPSPPVLFSPLFSQLNSI